MRSVLLGCRSLRSLSLRCRCCLPGGSLVGLRVPSSVARPGPRPGASVVAARLRLFAPCGRLRRPRSRAAPALRRSALPAVPLPRAGSPFPRVRAGPAPCRPGAFGRADCAARFACWGDARAGPPVRWGDFFSPLRTQLFFLRAPVRKLGKIRPQKTAKDPRFSGVFSSLDNIGDNFHAFLHEVAPSYPQEKFRFFAKKQDTPCKDCFSVLLSEW